MSGAGGARLKELGKGSFSIELGSLKLQREIIVAKIEDDALLGIDILQNESDGPADIMLSQGIIKLKGHEIPCIQEGVQVQTRKVSCADHYEIPGYCEAVIDVYVERYSEDNDSQNTEYLVESLGNHNYPIQVASTLVDIRDQVTNKVRVLNPYPDPAIISQNSVIGRAEQIIGSTTRLFETEDGSEYQNNVSIRRVKLCESQAINSVQVPQDPCREQEIPTHLRTLYERSVQGRNTTECDSVKSLLCKYSHAFSKDDYDLGLCHLTEHAINVEPDARPIRQPPRRVPPAYADEERKAIEDLEKKGVIQKSTSPWSSAIVLVKKKNGGIRPCVDYRRLNALVRPEGFPMPRIQDCLDAVAGATLFSVFDLTNGYFQIPLKKEDIPKSSFVTKYGQYEFKTMPFGLNSASSTFQRTMELVMAGLQWTTCLIYIDDIIVFSKNFEEHISRVEEVLSRISRAGLKLRPDKCEMLKGETTFLGHVVSGSGIRPCADNIMKIMKWTKPKDKTMCRKIIGLGSYYRRFVKDFSKIVRPIVELTRKGKRFVWDSACEEAFDKLKSALIGADVMGYPRNAGLSSLDVDASEVGLGGILSQEQEGRERVIAYGSRALNRAERNYCVTQKE